MLLSHYNITKYLIVLAISEATCFVTVHNIICNKIHIFNFQSIFIYRNCSKKFIFFYIHASLLTEIVRVLNKQDRSHKNCGACVCVCGCVGVWLCGCVGGGYLWVCVSLCFRVCVELCVGLCGCICGFVFGRVC